MWLSRLLTVPALALRTTAAAAGVLARIAEDAASNLARAGTRTGTGEAPDASDFLDLSDGAVSSYGAARLARTAPALSAMSDGAASEARLKAGTASDEVTAGRNGEAAPVPPPTVPAEENARQANPRPRAFDPARITSMPVREAIQTIESLSTEELHAVLDHETANRNRKTILRAVEQSLTAPSQVGAQG